MVESITPSYYAQGMVVTNVLLTGRGLLLIPDDAVGVLAISNNNPLQFRTAADAAFTFHVGNHSDVLIEMVADAQMSHGSNIYLGGIVSANRQEIYWVNETQPLP